MSTRSQIQMITKRNGGVSEKAQIYRHSDGYPSGIISDLKRLYDLQLDTNSHRGASYTLSNFVFMCKFDGLSFYQDQEEKFDQTNIETMKHLEQPFIMLGYGIEAPGNGIHGDEEYLYHIVEEYPDKFQKPRWKIRIAGRDDFPRFDDNDNVDDAFLEANWCFEGSLEKAYNKFVKDNEKLS